MKAPPATRVELGLKVRRASISLAIIAALLAYGGWKLLGQTHGPVDVSGYHYACYQSSQVTETTTPPMTSWNLARADMAFFTSVVDVDPETGTNDSALTEAQRESLAVSVCRSNGRGAIEMNALWMLPLLLYGLWLARRLYIMSQGSHQVPFAPPG